MSQTTRQISDRIIGNNHPTYVIAEIGINHNGSLEIAKKLIDHAAAAGCDAVKFQKRTPELCVPEEQKNILRETPWGLITYLEYRYKVEFGLKEYQEIDDYCRQKKIHWFASCWDEPSVDFINQFSPVCFKFASASLTDDQLLKHTAVTGKPLILSTGMSTLEQIDHAVRILPMDNLMITHSTSTYPCPTEQLNLKMIAELARKYPCPIGYSGHETGLQATLAAVVLGASLIERHITLDRSMWGSDQSASVEPHGFSRLVRDIRIVEKAMGDGVKHVYEEELKIIKKLRRHG